MGTTQKKVLRVFGGSKILFNIIKPHNSLFYKVMRFIIKLSYYLSN